MSFSARPVSLAADGNAAHDERVKGKAMSDSRATDVDEAVALIRQAMEKVETLHRTPREGVTTNGIVVVLNDAIRRLESLGDEEGD